MFHLLLNPVQILVLELNLWELNAKKSFNDVLVVTQSIRSGTAWPQVSRLLEAAIHLEPSLSPLSSLPLSVPPSLQGQFAGRGRGFQSRFTFAVPLPMTSPEAQPAPNFKDASEDWGA